MNIQVRRNIGRALFIIIALLMTYGSYEYLKYFDSFEKSVFGLIIFIVAVLWSIIAIVVVVGISILMFIFLVFFSLWLIFYWSFIETEDISLIEYLKMLKEIFTIRIHN